MTAPAVRPYGAYDRRQTPPEDAELTHVGPGTPGGEYLRRFWHPVAFSGDLRDLPLRIRILGEDLVVFRDRGGRVGLLQLHCSHRGTSLEFGIISERGIRCCYHGWLFDVDGRLLETPAEPAGSALKDRLCHGAYPTLEYHGLVFAYLGPPDRRPAFPVYDKYSLPGYHLVPLVKDVLPCNWVQIKENSMDPVHIAFLHTIDGKGGFTEDYGVLPELEWTRTPLGLVYIATRRVGDAVRVRTLDSILPNVDQFIPITDADGPHPPVLTRWSVPVDDTRTMNVAFMHVAEGTDLATIKTRALKQTAARPYAERQRSPGDFEAQTSRAIAIHALEHPASSDTGVMMFRQLVRDGIRAVARGDDLARVTGSGGVVPTYALDVRVPMPPVASAEADRQLVRETGRRLFDARLAEGRR